MVHGVPRPRRHRAPRRPGAAPPRRRGAVAAANELDAVVLDLDDTLLASSRAAQRARRRLRDFGVTPRRFLAADRRWWERYLAGEITIEQLRANRWRDVGLDETAAAAADDAYRTVARLVNVRLGARRLLQRLREAGLRTVILTNGSVEPQWRKIERAALHGLVDGVVITEAVGHHKPDRRAFDAALAKVDATADAAAMVGDTYENDIAGALDAGFAKVVWLTTRGQASDPRVRVARRVDDVLTALVGSGSG